MFSITPSQGRALATFFITGLIAWGLVVGSVIGILIYCLIVGIRAVFA